MGENKTNLIIPEVNGKQWEEYFKTIFKEHEGKIEDIMNGQNQNRCRRRTKFTMTKFQTTISKLKNNKAVGPHRIPNEIIKHEKKEIILKSLNLNIKFVITAEKRCEDFITLIHKEGKGNNHDNYRGICIANSILKSLSSVLEAIQNSFARNINNAQIGFHEDSRTSDHILTLKSIINKYVTDQKYILVFH